MPAEGLVLTESFSLWDSGLVGLAFMLEGLTEPASLYEKGSSSSTGTSTKKRVIFASAFHRSAMMASVSLTNFLTRPSSAQLFMLTRHLLTPPWPLFLLPRSCWWIPRAT